MKCLSGSTSEPSSRESFNISQLRQTRLRIRNMNVRFLTCFTLMVVALVGSLEAQRRGISVDQVHGGSKLVAVAEVPVRDSAPSNGGVYTKGQQTGTLRAGNEITVTGEQIVPTLLGAQKWVSFSSSNGLSPSRGWVFLGYRGKISNLFDETR